MNFCLGASSVLWNSFNDTDSVMNSFNGFKSSEIYDNSLWTILPRKSSTTVSVNPNKFDSFTNELDLRYGSPESKGKQRGNIYRCKITTSEEHFETVTVTCYPTTSTVSIQGSYHWMWTETTLKDIGDKLSSSATVILEKSESLDLSLDDSQPSIILSSTPRPSLQLYVTTGTQTPSFQEAATQPDPLISHYQKQLVSPFQLQKYTTPLHQQLERLFQQTTQLQLIITDLILMLSAHLPSQHRTLLMYWSLKKHQMMILLNL